MGRAFLRRSFLVALPALAIAGSALAVRNRLPAEVAVQWGLDGEPNYGVPLLGEVLLLTGVWLVVGVKPFPVTRTAEREKALRNPVVPIGFALGLLLAVHGEILYLNLDARGWERARSLTWPLLSIPFLAGAACAGVAWALVQRGSIGPGRG